MVYKLLEKYRELPKQLKASMWFLICSFLQKGISVVVTPIFTRLMSPEDYGQYGVFNSWLSIITVFVTLNLFYGVYSQGLVKFEEDRKVFVSSLQGLVFTMTILWTCIYLPFSSFWNSLLGLTTVQMLAMLLMIWTSAVFNFWLAEQRVDYHYKMVVVVSFLSSFLKPCVSIYLVIHSEDKVTARVLGIALVELILYTIFFFVHMRKGKTFYSKIYWKYALLFNIPLIPHYLSQSVLSGVDRIMIKEFVGAYEAGIYNLAHSISLMMTIFNTSLLQTMEPWIFKKIKENKVEDISSIAYISLIIVAAVNLLFIAFAPELISIFAPNEYEEAIWTIPPITMSVFFMFAYSLFATFEFYFEKTKFIAIATVISAVVNIVLNVVFINLFGYIAAGYTTLVCYSVSAGAHYLFMRKICCSEKLKKQPYDAKILLIITLMFLVAGFYLTFIYNNMLIRIGSLIVVACLLFFKRKVLVLAIKRMVGLKKM